MCGTNPNRLKHRRVRTDVTQLATLRLPAVRMTHKPSGFSVHVTSERSQAQNREKALEMIRGKLYKMREEANERESRGLSAGASTKIEWGSQIRSYVLHPYQLIKDHRTDHERRDVENVLDGDIQSFIDAEKGLGSVVEKV